MDGGAWWAAVHGVTKSRTRLSYFTHSLGEVLSTVTGLFTSVVSKRQQSLHGAEADWILLGHHTWEDAGEWKQIVALVSRQCWSHWDNHIQMSLPDCCQKFKHNKGLSKSAGVRIVASKEHHPSVHTLTLLNLLLDSETNSIWLDASIFPKFVSSSENGVCSLAGLFWVLNKVIHRKALLHRCAINKCSKTPSRSKYNRRSTRLHLALKVRCWRSAENRAFGLGITPPRPHPEKARAVLYFPAAPCHLWRRACVYCRKTPVSPRLWKTRSQLNW